MTQVQFLNNLAAVIIDAENEVDLSNYTNNPLCPKEIKEAISNNETSKSLLYLLGMINYKNNGIAAISYKITRTK
ncbi:MAG: hypothetical protein JST04_00710 [Bdellovibrionales bacterium]|nr:hypothetical protein [Bdellovibrionales bacterium]